MSIGTITARSEGVKHSFGRTYIVEQTCDDHVFVVGCSASKGTAVPEEVLMSALAPSPLHHPAVARPRLELLPPLPARPSDVVFRRRRLAVAFVVLLAAGGALAFMTGVGRGAESSARGDAAVTPQPIGVSSTWRVQPGDTVWRIARVHEPTGDIRPLVSRMSAERQGRPLQIGEVITLPS